jgi:plasmid replication initiation protein
VLTDYYSTRLGKGETPWIPIPLFQRILGTNYADWRNIKRKQIDEPLERLKDLDFTIKVELKRRGRKVVAVKFTMKRKSAVAKPKILPRSVKEAWESLNSIERNRIQMEALKRTPINPNEEEMNKAISEIIQERYL